MATQGNSPGLFSKVAKFVRNPTTDWGALDEIERPVEAPIETGKLALKKMIDRKRHNDAVRKREFDELRKLRNASPVIRSELAGEVSLFRDATDYSDLDERAQTLRKIDEIEAQMSKQWWKGRSGPGALGAPTTHAATLKNAMNPSDQAASAPQGFAPTQPFQGGLDDESAPTLMGQTMEGDFLSSGLANPAKAIDSSRSFDASGHSVFSASKMVSVERGQSLADPTMEEAAIRFANGDDAGAQAVLMSVWQAVDATSESAEIWAGALFDLFRCTGDQVAFDRFALDYARRFGRSAPLWYSVPLLLGRQDAPDTAAAPAGSPTLWVCPATLDEAAVRALSASCRPQSLLRLNWQALQSITPEAGVSLGLQFARWCEQPVRLWFDGVDELERVWRTLAPVGDAQVDQFWWFLWLDALRIQGRHDDFEQVALDFCITFELSPPSWQAPRCHLEAPSDSAPTRPQGRDTNPGADSLLPVDSGTTVMLRPDVELSGDLLGDCEALLSGFRADELGEETLLVSCQRLIRVDFSAAGSLLNWVAGVDATGGSVELRDVPRLVAAFFNLVGINEYAQVIVRTN